VNQKTISLSIVPMWVLVALCFVFNTLSAQELSTLKEVISKYGEPSLHSKPHYNKDGTRDERPNILFIMLDDARWDFFRANGGPGWFLTPNIDRIANEGANFTNAFAVLTLCTPSRGTFFTGLYPHKHGATTNTGNIKPDIPWISTILQQSGYYTGLSGKLAFDDDSLKGFDKWMISSSENYIPSEYNYNGVPHIHLSEHPTDVITDYALDLLQTRPPDQPFFIFLSHRAPHVPYEPRPEDEGIFDGMRMPYPANANKYGENFPSYLYPWNQAGDSLVQDSAYRGYFELLAGVEETLGSIFQYLDDEELMDKTLIIFTSDNGNIKSEHLLQGKQLLYEESIRLPMLVRFPAWFTPGTVVSDVIAANIDWAPTLLDAAQIPDTFGMDGVSLRQLATNEVPRHELMFEVWNENMTPAMRAVRTIQYKYINSCCEDTTEQFFDLVNDPHENTNLVNDPQYQTMVQYYRCKLDSMRIALKDFETDTLIKCKLKGVEIAHVGASMQPGPTGPCVSPLFNHDSGYMITNDTSAIGTHDVKAGAAKYWNVSVFNLLGELVLSENKYYSQPLNVQNIYTGILPRGLYIAFFESDGEKKSGKILVQ
jgi:N-acetylglucosamine-6-sulfatase